MEFSAKPSRLMLSRTLSRATSLITPPSLDSVRDAMGLKTAAEKLRAAFDQTVRSLHTVAEDDLVIDHWLSEGAHRGAFFGIEPTGKNVRIEGFSVWRIKDGRAVEAWGLVDIAGLMRQLKT